MKKEMQEFIASLEQKATNCIYCGVESPEITTTDWAIIEDRILGFANVCPDCRNLKSDDLENLATAISCGLFSKRKTLGEAWQYVEALAKNSSAPAEIWTAVYVVCNTLADELRNIAKTAKNG